MSRSLQSTLQVALDAAQVERVKEIDSEDFSSVARKAQADALRYQGIVLSEEFLEEGILGLKQYYAVTLLQPEARHTVSDIVDPFWHAHILHTLDYISFCSRVFGSYLHHFPLDHSQSDAVDTVETLYVETATLYRKMFSYINPDFFPLEPERSQLICYGSGNDLTEGILQPVIA